MLVYDPIKVPYRGSHHAEAYFSGSKKTNKKTTFRNKKPRGSHGSEYALRKCEPSSQQPKTEDLRVAKGTKGPQNPNFLSESKLAFRPTARMCPRALMMLRSYHGRVVPATTHRVAEVRSNQKDDTSAHQILVSLRRLKLCVVGR